MSGARSYDPAVDVALRRLFHLCVAGVGLWTLEAVSRFAPSQFELMLISVAALVLALGWLVWLGLAITRRRWARGLLVAPLAAALVVGLAATNLPFRLRWELSRGAFEAQVQQLPPEPGDGDDWVVISEPGHLGLFGVSSVQRAPGGVVFEEPLGGFDDTGVAWLPHGPDPRMENGSFERPTYWHIEGPWWGWAASW